MGMETAIAIIVLLVLILVAVGQPWLAILLAFGGALAIAGAPPSSPKPKKEWGDVPVPEAGGYPGWDFWKAQIEGATETAMKALRLGTGIQYAADALGDIHKKTLWDADTPLTIKVAKDPQEVEELQKKLAEIRKKIEKVYGKGEKAEGD